jgi:hypothetical protein
METEATGDAVVKQGRIVVFKFDDSVTIQADEVIVLRFIQKVRIVKSLVSAEIDLAQQIAIHEQLKGAINGRAGDGAVQLAGLFKQLVGVEMIVGGEGGLDDDFTLLGAAQASAGEVGFQPFFDSWVHIETRLA